MKKYYGYFVYNGEQYVIRFKIKGSLIWSARDKCFIDDQYYVRSSPDMICLAALDSNPMNERLFRCAFLIDHDYFVELRARGIKRWRQRETIIWN